MRCSTHCPGGGQGAALAAAAGLAVLVAVVVFVAGHLLVLAAGGVLVAAATWALYRVALRHTVVVREPARVPAARAALPAARPPRALSAPRAIENRCVIDGVVIEEEVHVER